MRFLGAGGTDASGTATDQCMFLPKAQRADGHDWQSQLRTLISHGHSRCELRRRRDDASTTWPVSCGAHRQNGAAGGHRMALARARSGASDHPASDQLVHVVYSRRGAALGPLVVFPLLKIAPPAWNASAPENAADIVTI